ncbi:MAG: hemerythrin domain-containing protein [Anaerolineales bacterium]|jgi:hemerythrin-like domain-containing protein
MKATQILMEEHRVIERVIAALEKNAARVNQGATVRPEFFIDAADFVRGFADGCHHLKEEKALFPSMAAQGVPVQGGPIGVMLQDHEAGRAGIKRMRSATERWAQGDPTAKREVSRYALEYAELLRQHIHKEDHILFPLAERTLLETQQEAVAEAFDRLEHEETGEGVHEKYLALAEALEKEAAGG